jgi:hypothetical protein
MVTTSRRHAGARGKLSERFGSSSFEPKSTHTLRTQRSGPRWKKIRVEVDSMTITGRESQVENGFMEYDLGYTDLEEKTLQPLDNPFGPKVLPM